MPDSRAVVFVLSTALACACAAISSTPRSSPLRQTAQETAGLRYLLHLPATYESRSDWPLILFLHGGGERGRDLDLVRREGLPRMLETLPDFPFVVVSPQEEKRNAWRPERLAALLDDVLRRARVDPSRVYVTGISSGAVAALELAIRYPGTIAAIVPISAHVIPDGLCRMKDVPAWIFHSAGDERIPFGRAEKLARELEACGGEVKLTIYEKRDHDAWTETYRRGDLYDWMLRHRKRVPSPRVQGEG
jgi:predicted peptidase